MTIRTLVKSRPSRRPAPKRRRNLIGALPQELPNPRSRRRPHTRRTKLKISQTLKRHPRR